MAKDLDPTRNKNSGVKVFPYLISSVRETANIKHVWVKDLDCSMAIYIILYTEALSLITEARS